MDAIMPEIEETAQRRSCRACGAPAGAPCLRQEGTCLRLALVLAEAEEGDQAQPAGWNATQTPSRIAA